MNEFIERRSDVPQTEEIPRLPESADFSADVLIRELDAYVGAAGDTVREQREVADIREYGLRECADAVKRIFTPEVFAEWGRMREAQREAIVREYASAIGSGLNIDFRGVVFEKMADNVAGYNSGDGYLHLNHALLKDPGKLVDIIDTVAHEARHQFQFEAIQNPEKYGVDADTVNEWTYGFQTYTTEYATKYDPWGYVYNPVEMDARYFGESIVRELRRGMINDAIIYFNKETV